MRVTDHSWASLEVSKDRTVCIATPHYDKPEAAREPEKGRHPNMNAAMRSLAARLVMAATVEHEGDLKVILDACTDIAQATMPLSKGINQVLGANSSPNFVRVPFTTDKRLDMASLMGTILMPGVKHLKMGDHLLPAPLYVKAYKIVRLVNLRPDGVLDCGLYFDLSPMAVVMDTTAKMMNKPGFDIRVALVNIAKAAVSELTHTWTKNVLNYHSGWSISAQLHVRVDIANDEITITPEMATFIAEMENISPDEVDGRTFDLTGYPLVNAACKPRLKVRVLDEEGLMPHFGLAPQPTDLMGRDNDGDAPTLNNFDNTLAESIQDLLSRKDTK